MLIRNRELLVSVWGFAALLTLCFVASETRLSAEVPQQDLARASRKPRAATAKKPRVDYTNFSHQTHVTQQKLSCDACHKFPSKNWKEVRKADAAFEDISEFPEHSSCLNCHRQQFFARERPAPVICSNCHAKVTPRDTTRFLFPSLGDVIDPARRSRSIVSEFVVSFPHDKHMEVISRNTPAFKDRAASFVNASFHRETAKEESDPKLCVICHQTYLPQGDSKDEYVTQPPKTLGDAFWLKKGTFKTIPVSHSQCSSCHSTDSGIEPALWKCDACHKLLPLQKSLVDLDPKLPVAMGITDQTILSRWEERESSATFPHDGGAHPSLACTTCHNVPTMNMADARTLKVAIKSCGGAEGCHITATSDEGGALNFEIDQRHAKPGFQCTKCHLIFGTQALPANHMAALTAPAVK